MNCETFRTFLCFSFSLSLSTVLFLSLDSLSFVSLWAKVPRQWLYILCHTRAIAKLYFVTYSKCPNIHQSSKTVSIGPKLCRPLILLFCSVFVGAWHALSFWFVWLHQIMVSSCVHRHNHKHRPICERPHIKLSTLTVTRSFSHFFSSSSSNHRYSFHSLSFSPSYFSTCFFHIIRMFTLRFSYSYQQFRLNTLTWTC